MLIEKNTVSAENQMKNSCEVFYLGNPTAKTRILVVGNSITRHGPNADIDWEYDWGMAASAIEKDYVHQLFSMLKKDGQDIFMRIRQATHWERNYRKADVLESFQEDRDFQADVVVFRLGENTLKEDKPFFGEALKKFIEFIKSTASKVIFTTCFWENTIVDEAIETYAKQIDAVCVDCCFSKDEKNMAIGQFKHDGVSIHPSDAGMEKIAKAIFKVLKK
jgi:alpha-galactosidase